MGSSFLNACVDRDGVQWGEHVNVDELVMLGQGIGKLKFCLPRERWDVFPGGMPYIVYLDKPVEECGNA